MIFTEDSNRLTRSEAESFAPTFSLNSVSVNFSPYSSINCVFDIRLVPVQRLAWYRVFLKGWFNYKTDDRRQVHPEKSWIISTVSFLNLAFFLYLFHIRGLPFRSIFPTCSMRWAISVFKNKKIHSEKMTKKHSFTSLK